MALAEIACHAEPRCTILRLWGHDMDDWLVRELALAPYPLYGPADHEYPETSRFEA